MPVGGIEMRETIEIRIPSKRQGGGLIDSAVRATAIRRIATRFAKEYGGAETAEIRGYFVQFDGRLVDEDITIISAYTDEIDQKPLVKLAKQLCYDLDQEAIALVLNGDMGFHSV